MESLTAVYEFLDALSDFFAQIFECYVLPGVSLFTILFYNMLFVILCTVLMRRR